MLKEKSKHEIAEQEAKNQSIMADLNQMSLVEKRLLYCTLAKLKESNRTMSSNRVEVDAQYYAELFDLSMEQAFKELKEANDLLFERYFEFDYINADGHEGHVVSRWVGSIGKCEKEKFVTMDFAPCTFSFLDQVMQIEGFLELPISQAAKQVN